MMYFIPWVVFLAVVVLSVPMASWIDGRKMRAEFGDSDDLGEEDEFGDFDQQEAEAPEGEAVEAGGDEGDADLDGGFGDEGDFGGEDFSEFEEIK